MTLLKLAATAPRRVARRDRGTGMSEIAIDPDPCLFSWGGCDETYHGGHECHKGESHKGRHQCMCGATSVRSVTTP